MIQENLKRRKRINLYMAALSAVFIFIIGLLFYWISEYGPFIEKSAAFFNFIMVTMPVIIIEYGFVDALFYLLSLREKYIGTKMKNILYLWILFIILSFLVPVFVDQYMMIYYIIPAIISIFWLCTILCVNINPLLLMN
ncbi:MAG: hypothetical protein M1317_02720 [Candidatus Thermoplasmatota archaeon]|nr:hypothetical protein [Candidatus Thermoplasmatota archaeon]